MNLIEKKLNSQLKFKGKIIEVHHDDILLPNGDTSFREVVKHPGGVCIAALNEKGEFLLVEQFRYAFDTVLLEFTAGKLEKDENPLDAANRELIEETGYEALEMTSLGLLYPSPGYLGEIIHLYYAPITKFVGQKLDHHEFLNVKTYTLDHLIDLVMKDELRDSKTIALIMKLSQLNSLK
jgi:ADP-ribose pyrophosphatase